MSRMMRRYLSLFMLLFRCHPSSSSSSSSSPAPATALIPSTARAQALIQSSATVPAPFSFHSSCSSLQICWISSANMCLSGEAVSKASPPRGLRRVILPPPPSHRAQSLLGVRGAEGWATRNSTWSLLRGPKRLSSCHELWSQKHNTRNFVSFASHGSDTTRRVQGEVEVQEIPFTGAGVGCQVWESSVACALLLAAMPSAWLADVGSLVELGSGVGLGGAAASELGPQLGLDRVVLSDCQSRIVELLRRRRSGAQEVREVNWNHEDELTELKGMAEGVLACDCVYYHPDMLALLRAAAPGGLLQPKFGCFLAPRHRACFQEFRRILRQKAEEEQQHWCSFELVLEGKHHFNPRLSGSLDRESRLSNTRVSGFIFASSAKIVREFTTRVAGGGDETLV